MSAKLSLLLLLGAAFSASALEITTEHKSKAELATVKLIESLRQSHDLKKWEFTDKVHIDETVIPHSHPLLKLNTRHTSRKDTDKLLATYLHEQIHWHLDYNKSKTESAVNELKTFFKNVPVGYPEGGDDENSTYEHLLVCYLELQAIAELLSKQRHHKVLEYWKNDHYTWIYKQVEVHHEVIAKVLQKHQLEIR
ncbi:hypothetical protein ACFOEE_13805 [Pseudoalteromonas fenneropenaei]|uniref:Secreted protein n=1 Tax=Pseudoalteromonas fenneropenaei TaxID=1737459 RepID=A0ABV7CLV7_9GAMM